MKTAFKAESKRLLEMMIHSIYTHKEIFLRELISNASDAIDKRYYHALNNQDEIDKNSFQILIHIDKENRLLTIEDNGIGMNEEDLHENLGTIAKSDSFAFKKMVEEKEVDIIGQFGVGFYSAFMVADTIRVFTKKYNEPQAFVFESSGEDGYEIQQIDLNTIGTKVVLKIKENTEEDDYDQYLDVHFIQHLIKKYSDYIRYPIKMEIEGNVKETEIQLQTINSQIPLWKKSKSEVVAQQYEAFYQDKFHDYEKPLLHLHTNVEGNVSFNALLFIPSHLPYNYYSNEYKKGLQLYSSGVFIMEHAEALIPEHFRFVKGLVDSYDLSLNISRELLQHDKQLNQMGKIIERKIKTELLNLLKNDRPTYEKFWETFGSQIKYGVYQDFGAHKDTLIDLLMFYSHQQNKLVTLKEFVENKTEKVIYYASGDSKEKLNKLPQLQALAEKQEDVLLLVDRVDEFAISMLREYDGYVFKNVTSSDVEILDEKTTNEIKEKQENDKELLIKLKDLLQGKVEEVILSKKLKEDAVCLTSKDGISFEMEKTLNALPNQDKIHAKKVLELNPNHAIYEKLKNINEENELAEYIDLLYQQAMLIEGFEIEDPVAFSQKLCRLMVK